MWRWLPIAVYAAFVFYLSSLSHPHVPHFSYSDKVYHVILYGGWGFLVSVAVWPQPCFRPLKHWKKILVVSTLAAGIYGLTDEIHQLFVPPRSFDLFDLLADLVGGFLGGCFYILIHWAYESQKRPSSR